MSYLIDAVDYGVNDFRMQHAATLPIANNKQGIFSGWFRFDVAGAPPFVFLNGLTAFKFRISRLSGGQMEARAWNAAATQILLLFSQGGGFELTQSSIWKHVLISWDLNLGLTASNFYIQDVDVKQIGGGSVATNDNIDWAGQSWEAGAPLAPTGPAACLADWYFAPGQYLDFSVTANRRKFITAGLLPVDLGSDGSAPTGTAPAVFFHLDRLEVPTNWALNRGSGGNFIYTGGGTGGSQTLRTATTSPTGVGTGQFWTNQVGTEEV